MRSERLFVWTVVVCLISAPPAGAQNATRPARERTDLSSGSDSTTGPPQLATPAQAGANAQASVPRLIRFSGSLQNLSGRAISGPADVTFALYTEESGGAPLWFETQTIQADALGHYSALLGAMSPAGVPVELFTEGQARWLGVMVQGLPEQSRVLLVSVPYALKAGDAETLGGRPATAYQLTPDSAASSDSAAKQGTTTTPGGKKATSKSGSPTPQTVTATQNYIPVMTDNAGSLGNSVMYQSSGFIGVGTTAPAFPFDLNNNVFAIGPKSSRPGAGGTMRFRDDSGTVRWLFGVPGTAGSQDFFMYNYANGHAPIYIQNGAASYSLYLSGNGNVGIGTTTPAAKLDVTGNINATGGITTGGTLNAVNGRVTGDLSLPQTTGSSVGVVIMGSTPFLHACCNGTFPNTFLGASAGNLTNTGIANVATGWSALTALTSGSNNTASGFNALATDTTGGGNTALGATALNYNTTGGANTAVGVNAGLSNNTGSHDTFLGSSADACGDGYGYSTAIGFGAIVCESNAIALGGTGTYAVKVGIGTGSPSTPLQVLNGVTSDGIPSGSDSISGACGGSFCRAIVGDSSASDGIGVEGNASGTGGVGIVANSPSGTGQAAQLNGNVNVSKDLFVTGSVTAASYVTSSSRRWKANIRPLRDSLGTVEQLRGVSYDWQSTGQHQIGVIAEEVVKVLPEVVALDPKDGSPVGVDYSRLTAVLVEAVKQQQKEILQLQREVKRLRAEKK